MDNGCINCTGAVTLKKSEDEKIRDFAKQQAKQTGKWIGLYRNEHGQLCICNGEQPQEFITPDMQ